MQVVDVDFNFNSLCIGHRIIGYQDKLVSPRLSEKPERGVRCPELDRHGLFERTTLRIFLRHQGVLAETPSTNP